MLEKERKEIDEVDAALLPLLEKRWDLVLRVAEIKKKEGMEIFDPEREAAILEKIGQRVQEADYRESMKSIYQAIFELSRAYQATILNKEEKR